MLVYDSLLHLWFLQQLGPAAVVAAMAVVVGVVGMNVVVATTASVVDVAVILVAAAVVVATTASVVDVAIIFVAAAVVVAPAAVAIFAVLSVHFRSPFVQSFGGDGNKTFTATFTLRSPANIMFN